MLVLGHITSVNTHGHDATCWCRILLMCRNACQLYQGTSLGHGLHVNMHARTQHIGTALGHGSCVHMCPCCPRVMMGLSTRMNRRVLSHSSTETWQVNPWTFPGHTHGDSGIQQRRKQGCPCCCQTDMAWVQIGMPMPPDANAGIQ